MPYGTSPHIVDFNLFVDIEMQELPSGSRQQFKEVFLGGYFSGADTRKFVKFGEQYFQDTSVQLTDIVHGSYYEVREENKERLNRLLKNP